MNKTSYAKWKTCQIKILFANYVFILSSLKMNFGSRLASIEGGEKMLFLMEVTQKGNFLLGMMPLIFIFVIFYFLLILPQKKIRKEHQLMLSNLTKGDKIVTNGGIYGMVSQIKDNVVILKIAENIKIEIQKEAVAQKIK